MIVPLKARGTVLGSVVFASPDRQYGPQDLVLAQDLALRAALAIDNARLYENLGSVARSLQQGLLPQRLPTLDGMDLAARYRPAGDGSLIGGDFYDVLPRADGLDLVIGDVTGKGARAAALTAQVRHTLRTAAQYEATPSAVLDVVNRTLLGERGESGRYCTVAMCRIELDGGARATICCAGHPMPMVVRASGEIEHVGKPGSVLGWVPDPEAARRDLRARRARDAGAVHRRRHRGAHERRRVRARRARGAAARGGVRGRVRDRRARGPRRRPGGRAARRRRRPSG